MEESAFPQNILLEKKEEFISGSLITVIWCILR